jgi:hypothetical protein
MSEYEDVGERLAALQKAAKEYRTDPRFRMMVDSCISLARQDHGLIDPEKAERDAHEVATLATALLLARIYHEDAEIRALRAERDQYRKIAEEALLCSPAPSILLTQK